MVCPRCDRDAALGTTRAGVFLCSDCCRLGHRCAKCPAGVLKYAPTPNDMGRHRCDMCKKTQPKRRLL